MPDLENRNVLKKAYIDITTGDVVTAEGNDKVLQVHSSESINYLQADDTELTVKQ